MYDMSTVDFKIPLISHDLHLIFLNKSICKCTGSFKNDDVVHVLKIKKIKHTHTAEFPWKLEFLFFYYLFGTTCFLLYWPGGLNG